MDMHFVVQSMTCLTFVLHSFELYSQGQVMDVLRHGERSNTVMNGFGLGEVHRLLVLVLKVMKAMEVMNMVMKVLV